jgi:hypothetical protein
MTSLIIVLNCFLILSIIIIIILLMIIHKISLKNNLCLNLLNDYEKHFEVLCKDNKLKEEEISLLTNEYQKSQMELKESLSYNIYTNLLFHYNIMTACKISCEQEKYSELYNRLYFFGINKTILDDEEKMIAFLEDIKNGCYEIQIGDKPFLYKFILKEKGGK